MEKKYIQTCDLGGIYGKRHAGGKNVSPNHRSVEVDKKDLITIYNKFYKDQVAALYRAIHTGR